jgi:hypothetical protein
MRSLYSKTKYAVFVLLQDRQGNQVQPKIDVKFDLCNVQEIPKNVRRQVTRLQSHLYYTYLKLQYGSAGAFLGLARHRKNLVHVSWIIPGQICNRRYSFIPKSQYLIGPCNTSEDYKGQGIFSYVLQQIVSSLPQCQGFWVFASQENISSLRAIEKAGGKKMGELIHTRMLWGIFSRQNYLPAPAVLR